MRAEREYMLNGEFIRFFIIIKMKSFLYVFTIINFQIKFELQI